MTPPPKAKLSLTVRLVSLGKWDKTPQRQSGDGFTVWTLGHANALNPIHCATLADAVKTSVNPDL